MDFAREMGYAYHLQFDDDAMLNGMLAYDIVQKLRNGSVQMGVFSDVIGEVVVSASFPPFTFVCLLENGSMAVSFENEE